jgi:hypothetical protein
LELRDDDHIAIDLGIVDVDLRGPDGEGIANGRTDARNAVG